MLAPANQHVEDALQRLVGKFLGRRYRIDDLIGVGGMGAVFRGFDASASRDVAIKLLRPELVDSVEAVSRFRREALAISRLEHNNCVRVSDVGQTQSGLRYMVMEFIAGNSLTSILGTPLPVVRSIDIARQVLGGLDHAHERNIVHRDIKPDNILLTKGSDGRELVKLVDFGIARVLESARDPDTFNTKMGHVFGTPQYMSPEQASGKPVDHRADIYTTGLVLYEMLSGQRAFDASSAVAVVTKQLMADPDPLPPSVPANVQQFVQYLMRKDPGDRFQSAAEAGSFLDRIISELFAAGWRDEPRNVPAAPYVRTEGGTTPPEQGDAQDFDHAMKAVLATSTERAIEGLGEGVVPAVTMEAVPRRRRSITQMSGIDLENLELEELGEIGERDD